MTEERRPISSFEVTDWDLMGRRGSLTVNGRKVQTPELMPVVNPNKLLRGMSVTPRELMEEFSFNMIITNSYIIRRSGDLMEDAVKKGLHELLDFDGVIMTDSGTFQSYIYGGGKSEVGVDPLEIIEFQNSIGADIGTILDRFTVPDSTFEEAERDLKITMERAGRSMEVNSKMELAVPVQGGRHLELRKRSGEAVRSLGIDYAPIGGVVPIMESYEYSLLVDVIVNSKVGLGPAVPAHLFGAGHPMIIPLAAALGCDLFDSASYVKFANDDRYMTTRRTYHLKELETFPCKCPVCSKTDPSEMRSLEKNERVERLSRHNLYILRTVIDEVRAAITEGTLWELVELSAMSNPQMYTAVKRLKKHSKVLERYAPRSTRRFMCSSGLSLARPEFNRYADHVENVISAAHHERIIKLTDWSKLYSRKVVDKLTGPPVGTRSFVESPLGPIPYELVDMYPLGQSIFPTREGLDEGLGKHMQDMNSHLAADRTILWDGTDDLDVSGPLLKKEEFNLSRVLHLIRYQFKNPSNVDPAVALFGKDPEISPEIVDLVISRNTGKIRNVYRREGDGRRHLLSIRAEDGLLTLKLDGARSLKGSIPSPWLRVKVDNETGEYNSKGYNVFCKFVMDADEAIRAGDDVMVVNEDDELLAVGRSQASGHYLKMARAGIGVKVKEGTSPKSEEDNN